jgi:hypothetical protein
MRLNKNDILAILGVFVILLICGIGSWLWIGESALIVVVIVSSILVLTAIFEVYRRLVIETDRLIRYSQRIEPLLSLFFTIRPQLPLPDIGKWAAPPDFLKKLTEIAYRKRPELVVEAGSGISTLILAYCLKQIGRGKVITLDHDAKYAAISQDLITFHGLEEVATVVHAPLIDYEVNGEKWLWYDTSCLQIDKPIDLLVVDGPPGNIQKLARYPVIPLLYKHFGDKITIIADDGNRKDEKEMVERWEKEFQDLTHEFLNLEKGAFLLYKQRK